MLPTPVIVVCVGLAVAYMGGVEVHKGVIAAAHKIVHVFKHKPVVTTAEPPESK